MTRNQTLGALLFVSLALLAVTPARAAKLTQVTADWKGGVSGLPSDITMYIYVPDKVAPNPPIVTLIHFCGGSSCAVFGQATDIVKAADQYGFIIVAPSNNPPNLCDSSSGRCWDVQTTKGLTRDGGGDTHAIKQMVQYALTTYKANPDRVYSTGDSSGGMTTQLMLALYPDIFKGGASFAGIPAGCRSGNETGNGYSSACAGGSITHTAQEWGDIVRKMHPGYSGHRPRVQLFHGDKDEYISYKVHAEAIKEWSNILGLDAASPTSTSTVTLGSHQATRQTWKNACGFVVLDAFMSIGGDHGPSDCLFNSYVAPFLGLDKTGAMDPEIEQCGDGTTDGGAGGAGGGGGAVGSGGSSGVRDGGAGGSAGNAGAGGGAGSGGSVSTGGRATGGSAGSGGSVSAGGNIGSGGNTSKGGASGSGGTQAGGSSSGGSSNVTGGVKGSGGAVGTGGKSSNGGIAGSGAGGTASSGGAAGNSAPGVGANGCGCSLGRANSNSQSGLTVLVLGLALATFARRRRSEQ